MNSQWLDPISLQNVKYLVSSFEHDYLPNTQIQTPKICNRSINHLVKDFFFFLFFTKSKIQKKFRRMYRNYSLVHFSNIERFCSLGAVICNSY